MDIFMTKPVQFREVGRILDGWMKSRERDTIGNPMAKHEVEIGREVQGEHNKLEKTAR